MRDGSTITPELGGSELSLAAAESLRWTPASGVEALTLARDVNLDDHGQVILGHDWLCVRAAGRFVVVDPTSWRAGEVVGTLEVFYMASFYGVATALGLALDDVTDVVVTYAHIDHLAGFVDSDGAYRFPRATCHYSRALERDALVTFTRTPEPAWGRLPPQDDGWSYEPTLIDGHRVHSITASRGIA